MDEYGRFVARVDGLWIPRGTVAEADGRTKYLVPGPRLDDATAESAAEHVVAERDRERRLLDLGLEVVRWGTAEIWTELDDVVRRVRETLVRGDLHRFRGHLRIDGRLVDLTKHLRSTELLRRRT